MFDWFFLKHKVSIITVRTANISIVIAELPSSLKSFFDINVECDSSHYHLQVQGTKLTLIE